MTFYVVHLGLLCLKNFRLILIEAGENNQKGKSNLTSSICVIVNALI